MYFNSFLMYYNSENVTLQNENRMVHSGYEEWKSLNNLYTNKGLRRLNDFHKHIFFCIPRNINNNNLHICQRYYEDIIQLKKKYKYLKFFNSDKSYIKNYKQYLKYEKYFSNKNLDKFKLFIIKTNPDFQQEDNDIYIRFVCERKPRSSTYPNQYDVYLASIVDVTAIPIATSKETIRSILEKYFLLTSFQNVSLSRNISGVRL